MIIKGLHILAVSLTIIQLNKIFEVQVNLFEQQIKEWLQISAMLALMFWLIFSRNAMTKILDTESLDSAIENLPV